MKLQKVEKLDKKVISSVKIYTGPLTSVIRFEWRFWGFLALTPRIWSNIAEFLTRGSAVANKKIFENLFKDSSIYGKGTDPKLAHLVQLWPLFSSWRWPKSKKNKR